MGCFALRSFYMKGVFSALGNLIDVVALAGLTQKSDEW